MTAAIRALRAPEPTSTGPAADALRQHWERQAALGMRADGVRQRVDALTALLREADAVRDSVASLRAARQAAAGRLVAEGRPLELRDHEGKIREGEAQLQAAEQRLAQSGGREAVESAVQYLCEQQRNQQSEAAALAAELPRLQRDAALETLAGLAPRYQAAIDQFLDELVEVAAAARAVDLLGPSVAGSTGVGSGALLRVEVGTLNHPAFRHLAGVRDFGARVAVRTRELLAELGAEHLAR